jgi:diguanylate cyclase (GGDEF)-like protein/PAS domain S-box-containing protein
MPGQFSELSNTQAQQLLHELRVHQVELEMQNDELLQKQAELDTSNARYFDFYDFAPVGYCTLSDKGVIRQANLRTAALLGVEREDLSGQALTDFILAHDQDVFYLFCRAVMANPEPQDCELRLKMRDSANMWVRLQGLAATDGVGGRQLRLVIQDINERKQAEAALISSEQRYRTLVEWSPEPVVVHRDGKILYVNTAARSMFGASSANALVGKPLLELVHPDFRHLVSEQVAQFDNLHLTTPMLEQKLLKLDGSVMDVEVQGTQIYFNGAPAVHAVMHDVTQRKQAEDKLRLATNVFKHTREGITVTNKEGVILDVNDSFTRITGYNRTEVLGQNPRILQSGRHKIDFYVAMWRDLLAHGYWSGEIWNRRKSGEIYPELITISAVTDAHGSVHQYVALFSDITGRKQTEDRLHQLAFVDALTGLPNRRMVSDRLGQSIASSKRSGRYGAVMALDLDNFKPLNDLHGHTAGDLLLQEAANRMAGCVREVDTVARVGGDEFVVILSELHIDKTESFAHVKLIAEKIRVALAAPYVLQLKKDGQVDSTIEHHCSVSIGVVPFVNHQADQEMLLEWADAAMYQAKKDGRNLVRFYEAKDGH